MWPDGDAAMDTVTTGATFTLKPNLLDEFRFNYSRTTGGNVNFMQSFGGGVAPSDAYLSQLYPRYTRQATISTIYLDSHGLDMRWYTGQYITHSAPAQLRRHARLDARPAALKAGFDYRHMSPIFGYCRPTCRSIFRFALRRDFLNAYRGSYATTPMIPALVHPLVPQPVLFSAGYLENHAVSDPDLRCEMGL